MDYASLESSVANAAEDDLLDDIGVPDDSGQAWLSLLLIGLIAGATGILLYAVVWLVAA